MHYVNYMIYTMIESVVRLIYRPILKSDVSFHDTVKIKFKDKAVEVSGQVYDNFRPL